MGTEEQTRETAQLMIMEHLEKFLDSALTSHITTSPYFLVKTETPIIAGYCIYREGEYLRSSLDSICMYVNADLLFEGRFLDFHELPEDNSYAIISDVASRFDPRWFVAQAMNQKFLYFDTDSIYGPMLEVEKRSLIFHVVRQRGFLFIIDGDEIPIGDVKAGLDFVRANPDKKIFWVYVEEEGNPGWRPRLIKVERGMCYGSNHWTILEKEKKVVTDSIWRDGNPDHAKVTQFKIHNFGSERSGKRALERVAYRESMRIKGWKEKKEVDFEQ